MEMSDNSVVERGEEVKLLRQVVKGQSVAITVLMMLLLVVIILADVRGAW